MPTSKQTYRPQSLNIYVNFSVYSESEVENTSFLHLDLLLLGNSSSTKSLFVTSQRCRAFKAMLTAYQDEKDESS